MSNPSQHIRASSNDFWGKENATPPDGYYQAYMVPPQMIPQNYYMAYNHQQPQYQQAPPPQPVQPKPIAQREKKILLFVDPNTNTTVNLPQKEQKLDASTASSPFEPSKQDTKPHTPVKEVKDAAPETEETPQKLDRASLIRDYENKIVDFIGAEENLAEKRILLFVDPNTNTTVNLPQKEQKLDASTASAPFEPSKQDTKPHTPVKEVKDAAPETEETPQKLDRASLIRDYENKIADFVGVEENLADIQNNVYSRKLVQLLREIIKNFRTVACPISEQELKRIGIDRATMPTPANVSHKSKYAVGHGQNFTPGWANNALPNIRRPYNSRNSKNNEGQNSKKNNQNRPPQITNRPSIQRQKFGTLTRGTDAWKPDVLNTGNNAVDISSIEARIAKTRKEVRGLLNKITPTTYNDLSVEMINKGVWRDEDTLPTVVELIFIKAVEEPTFVGLYSDLCHSLHKSEQNMEKENFKRHFHGAIIRKTQSSFETTTLPQLQEKIDAVEKELNEEEEKKDEKDEKKIADLNERLEDMKAKEKRRMLGTIKFISHLFRIGLLNYKIIENCIVILIRNAEQSVNNKELMTEYAVELMKHVGPHIVQRKEDTSKLDGYVTYLDKFKPAVSNRVKFMIIDLMELRDKKWVKKGDGPKTKKEVEADVLKEQKQNERDRDVYEQTAADQNRKRSNVMDKQQQRYVSRPSVDNKKDRLNAAAAAANNVTGSNLKKDTSLLKSEQPSRLGSVKKSWGATNSNTNANPPAAASNNKSNPRVINRNSVDARSNDVRKSAAQKDNKPSVAPTPKIDSRSASTTPPPADPSSSRSQNNTPTVTPEDQFNKAAFKSGFKERLQSHLDGVGIDEVVKSIVEFNNDLNNPVLFFEQMFKYCCEHLKLNEQKERHAVSTLVVKCFKDPVLKNSFAPAFKKYCKYLADEDMDSELPHLKIIFPEFVARLMTDSNCVPTKEFVEGFKEFHECENYMFARTLAEFGRILHNREETVAEPISWMFDEFANADEHYKSDDMDKILARQLIDYDENHKNLKDLIGSMH